MNLETAALGLLGVGVGIEVGIGIERGPLDVAPIPTIKHDYGLEPLVISALICGICGSSPLSGRTNDPMAITLDSTITCPQCGFSRRERMPTDACVWFWECPGCGVLLKPKPGDCCVYCSYADVPCPPVQTGDTGCCQPNDEASS